MRFLVFRVRPGYQFSFHFVVMTVDVWLKCVKRASKSRRSVAPARLLRCIAHRFWMPHKHNKETKKAKKKYERIRSTVDKLLQRLLLGVRVECSYCEIKEAVEHLKLIVADAPEEPEELDGGSLTKVDSTGYEPCSLQKWRSDQPF